MTLHRMNNVFTFNDYQVCESVSNINIYFFD
jgi:hypothetical protein